jgi:hypothetical protein
VGGVASGHTAARQQRWALGAPVAPLNGPAARARHTGKMKLYKAASD